MDNTKNIVITALVVAGLVLSVVVIKSFGSISNSVNAVATAIKEAVSSKFGGTTTYGGSLTVEDFETTANTVTGTTGALTVAGASSLTGTTSPTQLKFPIGGTIPTTATGTVRTVYTNTTGPKMCDSHSAFLLVQNNGSFAPSLVWSIGSSTSAAASGNIIASSTIATTTTTVLPADAVASLWRLAEGSRITAIFGDITNASASSTNLSNWSAEFGITCQELSI